LGFGEYHSTLLLCPSSLYWSSALGSYGAPGYVFGAITTISRKLNT
jgi:hypothetical protein